MFAGPGSPSYALAHWQAGPVAAGLRDRVLAGDGLTVLASAAAATAGRFTLPVYEIYKAGGAPRWLDGLDLLGPLGLTVALIPHYDNAEGGRYDTRHCYLGERRLAVMERRARRRRRRAGRGRAHRGADRPADQRHRDPRPGRRDRPAIRGQRGPARGHPAVSGGAARPGPGDPPGGGRRGRAAGARARPEPAGRADAAAGDGEPPALPLPEIMAAAERRFEAAAGARDADAMVGVILELETAIGQWEADMDEDQGTEQARALLRSLVGRLGRAAQDGLADPRDRLRPAVEPLLELRATLRGAGNFAAADAIREALAAAGLDVSDTPEGTRWQPTGTAYDPASG